MKNRLFASMALLFVAAGMLSSCCCDKDESCDQPCPPRACRPVCCPKPVCQPCPPACPPRCEPACCY